MHLYINIYMFVCVYIHFSIASFPKQNTGINYNAGPFRYSIKSKWDRNEIDYFAVYMNWLDNNVHQTSLRTMANG